MHFLQNYVLQILTGNLQSDLLNLALICNLIKLLIFSVIRNFDTLDFPNIIFLPQVAKTFLLFSSWVHLNFAFALIVAKY
jgi:hypothetical protein